MTASGATILPGAILELFSHYICESRVGKHLNYRTLHVLLMLSTLYLLWMDPQDRLSSYQLCCFLLLICEVIDAELGS
jgi:hypothetical protein